MNCKYCGTLLGEVPGGHRKKEFCTDAHRVKYWRQQHKADQDSAEVETLRAQNVKQARQLEELAAQIREQEKEIMKLKHLLDVDHWYRMDHRHRNFKAWLKKQPSTPLAQKILTDPLIEHQGSRSFYEQRLKNRGYSPEELHEFEHLWKALLQGR